MLPSHIVLGLSLLLLVRCHALSSSSDDRQRQPGLRGQIQNAANSQESIEQDEAGQLLSNQRSECLQFLLRHLPPMDKDRMPLAHLKLNVDLALQARVETPWAQTVPWELFLNDVLPHASLDEPRDAWRPMMHAMFREMVAGAATLTEAAQTLNREIWRIWGISFKPDHTPEIMSPSQVIAAGYASCTGLAIFLVNACRSVGIPARVVGTPQWVHPPSADNIRDQERFQNHDWVDIWDGQAWSFTGAAEYSPEGFNRTWFFPQPAKAQVPGDKMHAIYATSYKPASEHMTFPVVWNKACDWVNAEDVTLAYLEAAEQPVWEPKGIRTGQAIAR